jgi:glycosyltransferase involved in cell wall biosynthesis
MTNFTPAADPNSLRILMAIAFYPRGGSAQVARYLTRALRDQGHAVQLVSGSLKHSGAGFDAKVFFEGLPVVEVDYTEAALGFEAGLDPMSEHFAVPFQPSYEDKPAVPDRVFYRVSGSQLSRLVASWRSVLSKVADEFRPDLAHLHHLNHLHLAAMGPRSMERLPKIGHLHGTELKMLEEMKGLTDDGDTYVSLWDGELRRAAAAMHRFVAISPDNVVRAKHLLGLGDDKVTVVPNGVDVDLFRPRRWPIQQKMSLLEGLLVASPRGWDESGVVGSVRYDRSSLEAFVDSSGKLKPLLLFAGRFLDFKRLPLLMEAMARVNRFYRETGATVPPFNLLVCGGVPGEWEGEHPHTAASRLALSNVFFCGWLSHDELCDALNLADVFVAPSYYEPFGQVFLEAMATGVPVIATRSGGPLSFVVQEGEKANGWLADVDDVGSLAGAIIESISNQRERDRRGRNALDLVRNNYSWHGIAKRFEEVYRQVLITQGRGS